MDGVHSIFIGCDFTGKMARQYQDDKPEKEKMPNGEESLNNPKMAKTDETGVQSSKQCICFIVVLIVAQTHVYTNTDIFFVKFSCQVYTVKEVGNISH